MHRRIWIAVLLLSAGCGSASTGPGQPPPPVGELSLACPADVTVTSSTMSAQVTYPAPVAAGGVAPIAVSCSVASGATLSTGTTNVVCTATDARPKTALCNFNVVVTFTPPPIYLKYTKIMAFGDSVTEGQVVNSSFGVLGPRVLDPVNNYPVVLNALLSARYTQQTVTVVNRGKSSETAADGSDRLRSVLLAGPVPDVLLLLEGYNEMTTANDDNVATIANTLAIDIDEARVRGVKQVLLATFTPSREGALGKYTQPYILPVNAQVRTLAAQKGVLLVDLFAAVVGHENTLIGDDGLHPTIAGYRTIAETFFGVLKAAFEVSTPPSLLPRPARR